MVAIIDYDAGNIKSVEKAFEYLGADKVNDGLKALKQYMLKRYQADAWDQEDVTLMNREIEIREKMLRERDEESEKETRSCL